MRFSIWIVFECSQHVRNPAEDEPCRYYEKVEAKRTAVSVSAVYERRQKVRSRRVRKVRLSVLAVVAMRPSHVLCQPYQVVGDASIATRGASLERLFAKCSYIPITFRINAPALHFSASSGPAAESAARSSGERSKRATLAANASTLPSLINALRVSHSTVAVPMTAVETIGEPQAIASISTSPCVSVLDANMKTSAAL